MFQHEDLILASASPIRRQLLEAAGLKFETHPADIDEGAIKQALKLEAETYSHADTAQLLAATKATVISSQFPGRLVIGSDQILVANNQIYNKPKTVAEAREHLIELRGKTHELISAVSIALDGSVIWSYDDVARLHVRDVSNNFIGLYLAAMGEKVTATVGAYELEGLGVNLFEQVEGDYFTVLGLPMLPLLNFLRSRNPELV